MGLWHPPLQDRLGACYRNAVRVTDATVAWTWFCMAFRMLLCYFQENDMVFLKKKARYMYATY